MSNRHRHRDRRRRRRPAPNSSRETAFGRLVNVERLDNTYAQLAFDDEQAGKLLMDAQCHRQACYFFIQAMEKYVRYNIFNLVDGNVRAYRERVRTHDLQDLLECLIELASDDQRIREQITAQLKEHILAGVHFRRTHTDIRYPRYNSEEQRYVLLEVTQHDAVDLHKKLESLKAFLMDFHKLVPD